MSDYDDYPEYFDEDLFSSYGPSAWPDEPDALSEFSPDFIAGQLRNNPGQPWIALRTRDERLHIIPATAARAYASDEEVRNA